MLAGALLAAPLAAQPVDDATRSAARAMGNEGLDDYDAGRYEAAFDKLNRAYEVVQVPTLGVWSARALVKLERLVEAAERYREVIRQQAEGDQELFEKAKADANAELAELEPRIPTLRFQIEGVPTDRAEVTVDGVTVPAPLLGAPRPVNPGTHRVQASAGGNPVSVEVTVEERESKPVVLELTGDGESPQPDSPPEDASPPPGGRAGPGVDAPSSSGSGQRTAGFVALGVGGLGLVVGSVTGAMVLSKDGALSDDCPDNICDRGRESEVNQINSLRTLSTVGFIVGGVGAATGVTLLLTAPKAKEPTAAVWLGPGSVGVRGRF